MKAIEIIGKLYNIYSSGCSYYGNPHYKISVLTEDGSLIYGTTCLNGMIGYALKNGGCGENARMRKWQYHETRTGNIIFDFVRDLK